MNLITRAIERLAGLCVGTILWVLQVYWFKEVGFHFTQGQRHIRYVPGSAIRVSGTELDSYGVTFDPHNPAGLGLYLPTITELPIGSQVALRHVGHHWPLRLFAEMELHFMTLRLKQSRYVTYYASIFQTRQRSAQ